MQPAILTALVLNMTRPFGKSQRKRQQRQLTPHKPEQTTTSSVVPSSPALANHRSRQLRRSAGRYRQPKTELELIAAMASIDDLQGPGWMVPLKIGRALA